VALIPISGAFTERVFSQVALVREVGSDKMLQDLFELRVMVRANRAVPISVSGMQ
jgi:hypothetical protein